MHHVLCAYACVPCIRELCSKDDQETEDYIQRLQSQIIREQERESVCVHALREKLRTSHENVQVCMCTRFNDGNDAYSAGGGFIFTKACTFGNPSYRVGIAAIRLLKDKIFAKPPD